MPQMQDRAPLEKVRKLSDGRLTAVARFARSGVYQYAGAELGRPDLGVVNVYRPDDEVFSQDAMASFAHKSLTFDHPAEAVTARNWKQVAIGYTEGRVARDGGYVEIPLMVADAEAVAAYESGKATELSAGYSCDLAFESGTAPDGTAYQAVQRNIRGNHIAIVPRGRAGSECRIGDALPGPSLTTDAAVTEAVALAKAAHSVAQAHKGNAAEPWTAEMQARAVADAQARPAYVHDTAKTERLRQGADAAHKASAARFNDWRRA